MTFLPVLATTSSSRSVASIVAPFAGRIDAEPREQLQQARTADFPSEETARNIIRRVLATVGAKPAGHSINIKPKPRRIYFAIDFLPFSPLGARVCAIRPGEAWA
jgi:hypothetical protein